MKKYYKLSLILICIFMLGIAMPELRKQFLQRHKKKLP